ncbi:NAD(P)-dependent oxidoreductase [Anaerocolumna sp. AGMB13020]|uniref:NAD-dependent epimerase/dehydratase family protein n=1 Tax=Anaerocolumna sp. AGMB13020 TaxID=3081750 RepID=UPI002955727D|nr:NAD(P)-dependent oxidoreductase [Anaerocolumna sp. AGMB13020]WOO35157.1 NAD(P)-dependent oxidoreductase [Anaerocolumna sp. AGMB13020]
MKRLYVISGMTGMTGNELARQILEQEGGDIIGFDNFFASSINTIKNILDNPGLTFFEGDILDETQMKWLEKLVEKEKINYDRLIYINCAAVVHTEHFYHIHDTFNTNVIGMKNFLEQAIKLGANIYINCSTSEVYSMQSWSPTGLKEEEFITLATAENSQRTSYATGKLLTEFFIKDAVDKKKILGCSLRFANVYSKNELFSKHIIPHIIVSLLNENKVVLLENSKKNKRTFLNNIDSCKAILAVLTNEECLDGTTYNVATEEEISILELVYLCASKLKLDNYLVEYSGFRENDPERRWLSTDKLKKSTGWKPTVSLTDGIQSCVDYIRNIKE